MIYNTPVTHDTHLDTPNILINVKRFLALFIQNQFRLEYMYISMNIFVTYINISKLKISLSTKLRQSVVLT